MTDYILKFSETGISDVGRVGGKNASLGEMITQLYEKGVNVPDGFSVTAEAYREFIRTSGIKKNIIDILKRLDRKDYTNLNETGKEIRQLILSAEFPESIRAQIISAYHDLAKKYEGKNDVAVRSSATAEDLPDASFAGQHDTYLNVVGEENLIHAVRACYASLFNDRAIKYREDRGFDHLKIALSAGVQKMVRSDAAGAGIGFTLDPETGFRDVIHISATWGLGENIVQGIVNPDEILVFKTTLKKGKDAIIQKKMGDKEEMLIYPDHDGNQPGINLINVLTPEEKRRRFVLNDEEIAKLANWAMIIEEHYGRPMDFEWAKDGFTDQLFITQARPETVQSNKNPYVIEHYHLRGKGTVLAKGNSIGSKIACGMARIIDSPEHADQLKPGEILITKTTNPDWNAVMKKAAAIVTDKGGRTSHASIVARELGIVAGVGMENATEVIKNGQMITVDCSRGKTCYVYDGKLNWDIEQIDVTSTELPKTHPMLILGDPEKAFQYSFYPNEGIGLMRLEFIISNSIKIHPMALANFDGIQNENVKQEIEKITWGYADKKQYFIDKLAQSVAVIAAAFYGHDVIVRMSDFKSNEYANLIGGQQFELKEENPMIGFRGASRYYHPNYQEGFMLECAAMKKVREEMGFENVKLMIPFCRTIEEGKKVIAEMSKNGLNRGEQGLEIYMMAEIPSNVILADEFAKLFDGFSIGSNDLTQLTLGIDRDSEILASSFSEKDEAVLIMIRSVIASARRNKVKIGLCGQAPSDSPEFAKILVEAGIDSISFNPDALMKGIENIKKAEEGMKKNNAPESMKKHGVIFGKNIATEE